MDRGRKPELDGLRAIAVLLVMLFHAGRLPGGQVGVDVFFVLSGWLITGLLAREVEQVGRIDLVAFWSRRATRILPPLAALLVVMAAAVALWPGVDRFDHKPWGSILAAATFTADFRNATGAQLGGLSHVWSLSIEEQFYLVWPLLILATRGRGAILMLAAWLALTVFRDRLFLAGLDNWAYFSPFHASGLLLGSALALRMFKAPVWAGYAGLALVVAAATVRLSFAGVAPLLWTISAAEIGTALIITAPPAWMAWTPLRAAGRVSYGAYLWHVPLLCILPPMNPYFELVAAIGGGFIPAAISWSLIERPLMRGRWSGQAPQGDTHLGAKATMSSMQKMA